MLFNQGQIYHQFLGTSPYLVFFFTLHDHRVIAKLLHECFAPSYTVLVLSGAAALVACLRLQLSLPLC